MKFRKQALTLYAVTDRAWLSESVDSLYDQVERALIGGATMVQLREKNLDEDSYIAEGKIISKLCHKYGAPLIVNDNLEIALKCGADGVHVGISDIPVSEARKKAGNNFIIGATAKTVTQAITAEGDGADYIGVGAVFTSPTKRNAIRITMDELSEIAASVKIPSVAIGGIDLSNVNGLKGSGVHGIAAISAIFSAVDITNATAELKKKVMSVLDL